MTRHAEANSVALERGGVLSGSLPLFRPFGFTVRVHWSWPIIVVLVTWSLASGYLPSLYPEWSTAQRWFVAAVTSLLFSCSLRLC